MTAPHGSTPVHPSALDGAALPAERARTVAARAGAALCLPGREPARPLAHATTAAGQVLVLVPSGGEAAAAVEHSPERDLSALLMVSDRAPVPLRDPVRAQVWLSGWLTPVPERDARAAALEFAAVRPAGDLLDVGRTTTLLRLDLAEVVLREGERCTEVGPADFAAARPDPLLAVETRMLTHVDRCHPEVLATLARLLPAGSVGAEDVVRPLGLDRYGYRLRIERPRGATDVRIAFPRPLTCAGQLHAATQRLLRSAP
ncbi:DUF2470 domain-containing protein [Blastococcus sp. TF02A-26]|uniref:DUF2470 domain-containing protein n=1 Tax=Blastococcus sp. TF02A-26 TaxID=2250577 RepID=UPI000DE808DF|nr:DUF2470 domain-containing protein [Blastococcus sp. TF02A-26]RBY84779.1 DUF2470 domain-containing protein [Blastococcus sp. TF02A-26]